MATKVLSIEIGQGLTRVVEMDYKSKNPRISNCFTFETPQGVLKDGIVKRSEVFSSLFKTEIGKRGIHTKKAVFVVSSTRISSREAKIPLVKENRIQAVVDASASEFFPVDMNQYHLVYKVIEKIDTKEEKALRLNLLAVPNDLTSCYYEMANSLGLELVALDFAANAVFQVVSESLTKGLNAVVKVDEDATLIMVMQDGKVELQRFVSYGINEAVETLRARGTYGENLSYAEAINVLSGKTIIRRYLNVDEQYSEEEDTTSEIRATRRAVTEALRYLIGNINRVLEYYSSRHDSVQFDTISLTGLGADFSGLSKLLTNELNQKVKVFSQLEHGSFARTEDEQKLHINSFVACIGAGVKPVNLIPEGAKKGADGVREKKSSTGTGAMVLGLLLCIACVAGAAFLYMTGKQELDEVNGKIDKVNAHIQELKDKGVEQVYNDYNNAKTLNEQLHEIRQSSKNRNENLVAFIEELEQKLPSNLIVLNFAANASGVSMSVECDSKETAAKALMQLRTFDSIQIVSSSGLTDSDSLVHRQEMAIAAGENPEDGEAAAAEDETTKVSFSVECVYKPVAPETKNN